MIRQRLQSKSVIWKLTLPIFPNERLEELPTPMEWYIYCCQVRTDPDVVFVDNVFYMLPKTWRVCLDHLNN